MSDPETVPTGAHREAELLPWYLNGTLHEAERMHVAKHLQSCQNCRLELEELEHMKRDLMGHYQSQPAPSPQLSHTVLATISAEQSVGRQRRENPPSRFHKVDQWFRSLLLPQWAPTLAALFLVAQTGLILWVGIPREDQGQVTSRSVGVPVAQITVGFQPTANEEQIRLLLEEVRGRITNGPSGEGIYTIEVPSINPATTLKKIGLLRSRADVIRSAEQSSP